MAAKIKVENPVVEMDGDEMTRYVDCSQFLPFRCLIVASAWLTLVCFSSNSVVLSGR